MKNVWVVFQKERICGMFHTRFKALDYIYDEKIQTDENIRLEKMTINEYKKMCYNNYMKNKKKNT